MRIRGYKFGHPVFGYTDYFDFHPDFDVSIDISDDEVVIASQAFNLGSNTKLKEMLKSGEAILIAEIFCTYTMFRKCIKLESDFKIKIPVNQLKNKVECLFFIVSNEDIDNYNNSSVQDAYKETYFVIEKGDVLAFLGDYSFDLDLKGTTIDSFLKIRKKNESTPGVDYIFESQSLIIQIEEKDYDRIKNLHLNPDYQHILISSLLQPALIHASYKLTNQEEDGYSENAWYRTLIYRWEQLKKTQEPPTADDIPEFVESLLNNPTERLVDVLNHIEESRSEGEE